MTGLPNGRPARQPATPRPATPPPATRRPATPRPAPLALVLAAAFVLALLAPVTGLVPATGARAVSTDLTLVADAVYSVQPAQRRVRVTVSIVARNRKAETRTRKFYFDHAFLAVPPGTGGYGLSGAKGATVRVAKRTRAATLLRIGFGPRLYGGQSRTYRLTFSMVDKGGAANRPLRVGTSLVTLPVWAYASDGAKGSTVRVRFPGGYDVAVESGSFATRTTTSDGGTQLATGLLSNPVTFFAYVTAQREATFVDTNRTVAVGGRSVTLTLRAWKDDHAWARRTGGLFAKALPALHEAIGLDWPATGPTVVQEAASRTVGGYAGLFAPAERRIEVAYWADPMVTVHEAAHGWFNGLLLADRWANEGFASLYAQRTAAAIGVKGSVPRLTDAVRKAAQPLNAWTNATGPEADRPTETYGYAASLALAAAIEERAGDPALRRVWSSAAAGIGAYQPPGATMVDAGAREPEPAPGVPDWRGLLDLLEAQTGKDFTDLWRQWVVRPDEVALLDARAAARQSYQRTLALAGAWALPRPIRDALRTWQFDTAEQLMADARTVLAQRSAVQQQARQAGLSLPATMQQQFEEGMLGPASAEAESERNAMLAIAQAEDVRANADDVLTQIGMLGEHPEADLAAARAALAAGNLDGTLASADDAYRAWNGAWQEGRRRALLAVAVLASVLVLVSAMAGRARRSRRQRRIHAVHAHRAR